MYFASARPVRLAAAAIGMIRNPIRSRRRSQVETVRRQSEMGNNAGDNTPVPEDGAGDGVGGTVENRGDSTEPENTAAPNGDNASGLTDGNANGKVNDITDDSNVNDATDNGTGVGGAAKDIVDGVGDAGKDLIDGVEDAGDALVGEEPADTAR